MTDEPLNHTPPIFNIPPTIIEGWLKIPPSDPITITLTRQDMDNLFFTINSLVSANAALQQCLISYSNGKLEEANRHMAESQRANIESLNSLRYLFNALMSSASSARDK